MKFLPNTLMNAREAMKVIEFPITAKTPMFQKKILYNSVGSSVVHEGNVLYGVKQLISLVSIGNKFGQQSLKLEVKICSRLFDNENKSKGKLISGFPIMSSPLRLGIFLKPTDPIVAMAQNDKLTFST